jgi:Signal peptidase subunit
VFAYLVVEFTTKKNHLNQVVVWSRIIQRIEDANIPSMDERIMYPYTLTDQGLCPAFPAASPQEAGCVISRACEGLVGHSPPVWLYRRSEDGYTWC